jgi:hypothetical protein
MGALLGLLKSRGFRKGILGQSRPWMALWVTISALQLLRRWTERKAVIERFTLNPGESILVTDLALPESQVDPPAP